MNIPLVVLGVVDLVGSLMIAFSIEPFSSIIGAFLLLKGIASVAGALAYGIIFDILGWSDVAAGLILVLPAWVFAYPIVKWFGFFHFLKALLMLMLSFF